MTEFGIYSIYHVGLVVLGPLVANRLLVGDFQGLDVLEPYCEDHIILRSWVAWLWSTWLVSYIILDMLKIISDIYLHNLQGEQYTEPWWTEKVTSATQVKIAICGG